MKLKGEHYSKWLIFAGILFCVAIILFIGSFTFLRDVKVVSTNIDMKDKPYLSFSTNYVSVGSPLTVSINNASISADDVNYEWIVGGSVIGNTSNSYLPTSDDYEKFITVRVKYDDESISATLYCSKLPVIYVNTNDSAEIGEEYVYATMAMQGSTEYTTNNADFYYGGAYLKLRGNSTKYRDKRPYKIKLDTKTNLFNMGSSKHWVLLANDIDHTFIRNKLTYDFSADLGASFASESINTILILNNEYKGVYQLAEQVRVDEERIEIFDWEELASEATKTIGNVKKETENLKGTELDTFKQELEYALVSDYSWISSPYTFTFKGETFKMTDYVKIPELTGGFVLEMDFYHNDGSLNSSLLTNYKQPFYFNTPEYAFTNSELKTYASKYIQSFEYSLHSYDFFFRNSDTHYIGERKYYDWWNGWLGETTSTSYKDDINDGKHYSELFDLNSLVNNFMVCEFTMNWDSMKNSVFVTKDIGKLAELNPVWDFDWAYGNLNMFNIDTYYPTDWHTTIDYFTNEQYYQSVQWNRFLIRDPYFLLQIYNKYKEIRPTLIDDIIKENGTLDKYYDLLKEAGVANDALWSYSYREYNSVGYEKSMENLRTFIEIRVDWLDKQFASLETLISSLDYYSPSDKLNITNISSDKTTTTITASTSLTDAASISFQINGTTIKVSDITDGTATITFDNTILSDSNIVQIRAVNQNGEYITETTDNFSDTADSIVPISNYKVF